MCECAVGQSTSACRVTEPPPPRQSSFPLLPVSDSRPFRHAACRSGATQSNERTTEYRVWCRLRTASETFLPAAELPLLCPRRPAPPPVAVPMITTRGEDKFSLIRKRRIKLYTSSSMAKRAQKLQAKEKRKDKNCRRRPSTSPVSFLCTALPSAAVGKCAHQYKLKTEVCRHLAEKTDAIEHDA